MILHGAMDLALCLKKFISIGIVGVNGTSVGFGSNEKTNQRNIYYYKQEAKTNEQIRLEYLHKTGILAKQKSQPIPIPKFK